MKKHLTRRGRVMVAAFAAATLTASPVASWSANADEGNGGVEQPKKDHHSDVQAKHRHAAKNITPAERRKAVAAADRDADDTARRLGMGGRVDLQAKDVVQDADGTEHSRYERTFSGLRVVGGDVVVHTGKKGGVKGVERAHRGSIAVDSTHPSVAKKKAARKADRRAKFHTDSRSTELVVFAVDGKPKLAWDTLVEGVRKDQTPSRLHVFVDARTGKVLDQWDEIHTGQGDSIYSGTVTIGTTDAGSYYEMRDNARGGNYTTDMNNAQSGGSIFTDSDDAWGNGTMSDPASAGVDAHYGAALTWDYYQSRHGRNGIFDNGQGVPSRVHYGNGYVNAFWDGQQMTYGDGQGNQNPLTEIDVAGHEMSHGVTEATAGLIYSGDAGGLNESTSDIFGTAVEFSANNAEDVGDYLIGEEIDINGNGTPLRYMDRPSRDGGSYDCWTSSMGNDDPHYTSGPGNHFFYLASEGSGAKVINGVSYNSPTCDGSSFSGIGRGKVEDVWYRALSTYMTSTTSYPEARDATVQAAIDLYGAESSECSGIEAAWDGVAVPASSVSCTGGGDPEPTGCDGLSESYNGSLTGSGDYAYHPGANGYYESASAGTHSACLDGPAGTDFDLYLEKWNGSSWVRVAASESASSHEEISYSGSAGAYSYVVQSYSGSGSYTFRMERP